MTDLEGSKDLFWQLRVEGRWGGGGGLVDTGSTVDYLPVVWLCFSAFLSLKESLLTTVL